MGIEQQTNKEALNLNTSWDQRKLLQADEKTANGVLEKTYSRIVTNINPKNWWVGDYTDSGNFDTAYHSAKKQGEKEFLWNGKRYATKQKLDETNIINYQKNKFNYENWYSNFVRDRLAQNTLPNSAISMGKVFGEAWNVINNKKERWNKNTRAASFYRNYLWQTTEEDKKRLGESTYKPSDYDEIKHKNKRYFSPLVWMNEKDINYYLNNCIKYQIIRDQNKNAKITDTEKPLVERKSELPYDYESREHAWDLIPDLEKILERDETYEKKFDELTRRWYSGAKANNILSKEMDYSYWDYDEIDVLWWHNIRFREDARWKFMEIRDTFDLSKYDKITKGKPFDIYDRIYYKDYWNNEYKQMFYSDDELKVFNIDKKDFDTLALQKELSNRWYKLEKCKKQNWDFDWVFWEETRKALLDRQSKY